MVEQHEYYYFEINGGRIPNGESLDFLIYFNDGGIAYTNPKSELTHLALFDAQGRFFGRRTYKSGRQIGFTIDYKDIYSRVNNHDVAEFICKPTFPEGSQEHKKFLEMRLFHVRMGYRLVEELLSAFRNKRIQATRKENGLGAKSHSIYHQLEKEHFEYRWKMILEMDVGIQVQDPFKVMYPALFR
jgi:hypothetical protein